MITPAQRLQWRAEAEDRLFHVESASNREQPRRILALLDALEEATQRASRVRVDHGIELSGWEHRAVRAEAALARVEALADEWVNVSVDDEWEAADYWSHAPDDLRAALADPDTQTAEGGAS